MRPMLLSFAMFIATVVPALSPARAADAADDEEGFVSMFNGRDFSGWRFNEDVNPATPPANWQVADGVIRLSGGGSPHLASEQEYGDYEMRFEWRALREKYNSGYYVRSGRKIGANQINLAKGSEGAFINGSLSGAAKVPDLQKPAGEWNEWRLRAEGDKVSFWCNGKLAWEATGLKAERGYIGFQAEGAPLEFRNLRIKNLGK